MVSSHYNKFYRLRLCFIACFLSVAFAAGQCKCNTNSAVATVGVRMNALTCSVSYNSHPVISPPLPSGLTYELTTIRKTTNITVSGVALHPIGLTKFLVSDGSSSCEFELWVGLHGSIRWSSNCPAATPIECLSDELFDSSSSAERRSVPY